jgi:hypothetical protein
VLSTEFDAGITRAAIFDLFLFFSGAEFGKSDCGLEGVADLPVEKYSCQ